MLEAYGQELEKKNQESKRPMFDRLNKLSETIVFEMGRDLKSGFSRIRQSDDPITYFVNHSVNVSVYSCMIGLKLNLPLPQVKLLTYATMVHDIGNLYLPKRLLYKRSELTEEEMERVESHIATIIGREAFLMRSTAFFICFGSGYATASVRYWLTS